MVATNTMPAVPVANQSNLVQVVNAIRSALIAQTNTGGRSAVGGATQGVIGAAKQSNFVVTNQIINNVIYPVLNPTGDTIGSVSVPQIATLILTNPATGEEWTWTPPAAYTLGGKVVPNTPGGASPAANSYTGGPAGSAVFTGLISDSTFIIDGGGSAITTGVKGYIQFDFGCTITQVELLADQSGSCVVDIWKVPYVSFPPSSGNSIAASDLPTLSSAQKYQDNGLTGWTKTINAGDIVAFNVNSAATVTRVSVTLTTQRT